ncbi:MAG: hypothetical protein R2873_32835 [Caldilineaceae bacterium]
MTTPPLFGPYGRNALEHADRLARFGANAAWFHMFDAEAFDICAQHGLAPCVEFKTFRADFDAHPELIPTGADGKPIRYGRLVQGVCLSQQAFLDKTEAALVEGCSSSSPPASGWTTSPTPGGSRSPIPICRKAASARRVSLNSARSPASTRTRPRRFCAITRQRGRATSADALPNTVLTTRKSFAVTCRIV